MEPAPSPRRVVVRTGTMQSSTPRETSSGLRAPAPVRSQTERRLSHRMPLPDAIPDAQANKPPRRSHQADDLLGLRSARRHSAANSDLADPMVDETPGPQQRRRASSTVAAKDGPAKSADAEEARPATPSQSELRMNTRRLKQRRAQPAAVGVDAAIGSLAGFIRSRVTATIDDIQASQKVTADLKSSREAAKERAYDRLEGLRKTYNMLHAEFVGKEQMHATLVKQLQEQKGLCGVVAPRFSPRPPAPRAAAAPTESGETSSEGAFYPGPRARASFTAEAAPVMNQKEQLEENGDADDEPTLRDNPMLLSVATRARKMQDKVRAIETNLDVLDYMERRTLLQNHKAGLKVTELRAVMNRVEQEAENLSVINVEAIEGMKAAQMELVEAREAVKEQAKRYAEVKTSRNAVNKDITQRVQKEADHTKQSKDIVLEGMGDLDAEGELALKIKSNEQGAKALAEKIEKEGAEQKVNYMEELSNRLRLAMPDPASVETPQDLLDAALAVADRKQSLQEEADAMSKRNEVLREECTKAEAELQHVMFFGSAMASIAQAEREMEPLMASASVSKESHARNLISAQRLVWDAKAGLSLLLHQCSLETRFDTNLSDEQLMPAFDRLERHLLSLLHHVSESDEQRPAPHPWAADDHHAAPSPGSHESGAAEAVEHSARPAQRKRSLLAATSCRAFASASASSTDPDRSQDPAAPGRMPHNVRVAGPDAISGAAVNEAESDEAEQDEDEAEEEGEGEDDQKTDRRKARIIDRRLSSKQRRASIILQQKKQQMGSSPPEARALRAYFSPAILA